MIQPLSRAAAILSLLAVGAGGAAAHQATDAQLRELVAALVEQARPQTPLRLDAERVWTGVRADGADIVYEVAIERDLGADELPALRRVQAAADPIAMCADATVAYLIGLGARLRLIYTDAAGDRFETLVDNCPAAAESAGP